MPFFQMEGKYTKYALCICLVLLTLPFFLIHSSFNSNDDQLMQLLLSARLDNTFHSNTILISKILGVFIAKLQNITSNSFNTYSILLLITQYVVFLLIGYLFIVKVPEINQSNSIFIFILLFIGILLYFYLELEFTSISILLCLTIPLFIIVQEKLNFTLLLALFLLALLWRKESGVLFFIFSIPLYTITSLNKKHLTLFLGIGLLLIGCFYLVDLFLPAYHQANTVSNILAIDKICARPTYYVPSTSYSISTVNLVKNWFWVDPYFTENNFLPKLSQHFHFVTDPDFILTSVLRFLKDERFSILLFCLTYFFALLSTKKYNRYLWLNLILIVLLFGYLIIFHRTPKRLTLPLFSMLAIIQLFLFLKEQKKTLFRNVFMLLFTLISMYKLYCLVLLSAQHKNEHQVFNQINAEINKHPEYLFIANPITIKLHYMNACLPPNQMFIQKNILVFGWITLSPDYKAILHSKGLNNLTRDIIARKDILFLNEDVDFENYYCAFLLERYHLDCTFIDFPLGEKSIHPRKLVLKNDLKQL